MSEKPMKLSSLTENLILTISHYFTFFSKFVALTFMQNHDLK